MEELQETLRGAFAQYADRPYAGALEGGDFTWRSYAEIYVEVCELAASLAALSPARGSCVAVCGHTAVEWTITNLAAVLLGVPTVALDPSAADDVLAHMTNASPLFCVVGEAAALRRVTRVMKESTPRLVGWDTAPSDLPECVLFRDFLGTGRRAGTTFTPRESSDDCFAVFFTSGSTGTPKAVAERASKWNEEMVSYNTALLVAASYQPPWHIADLHHVWVSLINGGQIGYFLQGVTSTFLPELAGLGPTVLFGTPRMFAFLTQTCRDFGRQRDAGVKGFAREIIGGRLHTLVSGGGAIGTETRKYLQHALGCTVVVPYGSTDTGNIAVNGGVLEHMEVRLVDLEGHTKDSLPYPRGEVTVRRRDGLPVALYLSATARVDSEGFFHTGDIGEWRPGSVLEVVGRAKAIIKLPNGESLSPEAVERACERSRLVESAFVTAVDGVVVAVLVPSSLFVEQWERNGSALLVSSVESCQVARNILLRSILGVEEAASLRPFETVRRVVVCAQSFTDIGLIGPAGNLKRQHASAHFMPVLQSSPASAPHTGVGVLGGETALAVTRAWASVLGEGSPHGATFAECGGDSLDAARLASKIRSATGTHIGISLPSSTLCVLVDHVQALVLPVTREGPARGGTYLSVLKDALRRTAAAAPEGRAEEVGDGEGTVRHVLLTGATGFVGPFLLASLLHGGVRVTCVVRGSGGEQKVYDALRRALLLSTFSREHFDMLHVTEGNLAARGLALTNAAELFATVDVVVHAGAIVNLAGSYTALKTVNVGGTAEVAKLCAVHRAGLLLVSSTDAANREASAYARTKAEAEELVLLLQDAHGVPARVVRLPFVGGNPSSGTCNPHDLLSLLLRGTVRASARPRRTSATFLNVVPAPQVGEDVLLLVSSCMHAHARGSSPSSRRIVTLPASTRVGTGAVFDALARAFHLLAEASLEEYAVLLARGPARSVTSALVDLLAPRDEAEGVAASERGGDIREHGRAAEAEGLVVFVEYLTAHAFLPYPPCPVSALL